MIEGKFHYHPRPDAQPYSDGARWDLGGGVSVTAIHLPGHTRGHCALLVEPAGVAFIGDIDLTGFGPYYGDATSSLADFRSSLEAVKAIPARAWVTSHHRGVVSDRATFLAFWPPSPPASTSAPSACCRCWATGRPRWKHWCSAA